MLGADLALEASVVGGFSRIGYLVRRSLFGWEGPRQDAPPGTAVVTGGSSGIGLATAEQLVRLGWSVTIVSKDRERSESALERLRAVALEAPAGVSSDRVGADRAGGDRAGADRAGAPPGDAAATARAAARVEARIADLADLAETRRLAAVLAGEHVAIDVLVHGAGALFPDFHRTEQGFEATFALHVLAPHVLTSLLLPALLAGGSGSRPSRVITVSSGGMYAARLDIDALEHATPATYRGSRQYALAKRAQVELAAVWAERLAGSGVVPLVMHPGWVDTAALASGLPRFAALARPLLRTPAEGADTIVDLALRPDVEQLAGELVHDRRPRARSILPGTRTTGAQRRAAFERVSALTGSPPIRSGR